LPPVQQGGAALAGVGVVAGLVAEVVGPSAEGVDGGDVVAESAGNQQREDGEVFGVPACEGAGVQDRGVRWDRGGGRGGWAKVVQEREHRGFGVQAQSSDGVEGGHRGLEYVR